MLHCFTGVVGLQGSILLSAYLQVMVYRVRRLSCSHVQQLHLFTWIAQLRGVFHNLKLILLGDTNKKDGMPQRLKC